MWKHNTLFWYCNFNYLTILGIRSPNCLIRLKWICQQGWNLLEILRRMISFLFSSLFVAQCTACKFRYQASSDSSHSGPPCPLITHKVTLRSLTWSMMKSLTGSFNYTWTLKFPLPCHVTLCTDSRNKNLAMAIFWILPKFLTIKYSWCIFKLMSHRKLPSLGAYETDLIFNRTEFLLLLLKFP